MNTRFNESKLQELAYTIWEQEGKPAGQSERHWNMAVAQAEIVGGQYLAGEGSKYTGISSDDQAAILADDREYASLTETEAGLETMEAASQKAAQHPLNIPKLGNPKIQDNIPPADETEEKSRKNSKKRKSNNILV